MTKLEQQKAAVSMAVRLALHKIGQSTIAQSEFFGTNQCAPEELKKAA